MSRIVHLFHLVAAKRPAGTYASLMLAAALLLAPSSAFGDAPSFTRTDAASVEGARGLAVADFDRNGWADVAFANAARNSVTILLNTGGVLAHVHDVPIGVGPFAITAADFNRDGIADLAVATADANRWWTLYGRGNATFAAEESGELVDPRGITSADMNRDGRTDVVVTSFAGSSIRVYLSTPAGFADGGRFDGYASRPQGVVARDFDRDGHMDMAVAYEGAGSVGVIYGTGNPNAFRAVGLPNAGPMNVITAADLNRDGWEDVAAASSGGSRVAVYLGSASGFRLLRTIATGRSPRDIVAADLDRDGCIDLITADYDANSLTVIPGSRGDDVLGTPLTIAAGRGSRALAVADFDIDGKPDIAVGNQESATTTLLTNATAFPRLAYAFDAVQMGTRAVAGPAAGGTTVVDFDHDGRLDVASPGPDSRDVSIFMRGRPELRLAVDGDVRRFWVADLNRDGNDDVLVAFDQLGVRFLTYLGDGHGAFTSVETGAAPLELREFELADANGDAVPDLLFVTGTPLVPYRLGTWIGAGDGTFSGEVAGPLPRLPSLVAAADLNRDGILDVVTCWLNEVEIWSGDGTGRFAAAQRIVPPGSNWATHTRVGDLNDDGFPDLVTGTSRNFAILLGSATGFSWNAYVQPWPSYQYSGLPFALADIDLDGHLDIVTPQFEDGAFGDSHTMRGTGTGAFLPGDRFAFTGSQIRVADFDGNGTPDIVTTPSRGAVRVALGRRGDGNRNPQLPPIADVTASYQAQYEAEGVLLDASRARDPDLHALTFAWRDEAGDLLSDFPWLSVIDQTAGTHHYTVTVFDGRGGTAVEDVAVTLTPLQEIVLHTTDAAGPGWELLPEEGAASGVRLHDPNRHAPKVTAPLEEPSRYVELGFVADPAETYKLWVRLRADGDSPYGDSVWIQISGAVDLSGAAYEPGTPSGLAINLEPCAGCGISGWGWADDGWGAPDSHGRLLRFPAGGRQVIRIQSREDGVSIDQIVLSSHRFLMERPGGARADTTILPFTFSQPLED